MNKFIYGAVLICAALFYIGNSTIFGQSAGQMPKVTRIDLVGLKTALKPTGKPKLVNFWATWCDPCREEFPDLVKLHGLYKDKVDLVTISMDDLAEIDRDVPRFLALMRSELPAYLLKSTNDDETIRMVSSFWSGNLPLTIIYDVDGNIVYQKNGKFRYITLKENLDRAIGQPIGGDGIIELIEFVKIKNGLRDEARYYYENNWRVYREEAVKRGVIHSFDYIETDSPKNGYDIILITRYKGEDQYKNSEKAFEPILKTIRPKGPLLRGNIEAKDFREIISTQIGKQTFNSVR